MLLWGFWVLVTLLDPAQHPPAVLVLGLAAVAAATLSYAWGTVVSRPLMQAMHPLSLAFWETALGAAGLVIVSLLVGLAEPSFM